MMNWWYLFCIHVETNCCAVQASDEWTVTERWLQERNARIYPNSFGANQFKILGYQWRVMRFNDHTRQSVAKVMACYRSSGDTGMYLMQQPHCLAVPCEFTSIFWWNLDDHNRSVLGFTSRYHLYLLIHNTEKSIHMHNTNTQCTHTSW